MLFYSPSEDHSPQQLTEEWSETVHSSKLHQAALSLLCEGGGVHVNNCMLIYIINIEIARKQGHKVFLYHWK